MANPKVKKGKSGTQNDSTQVEKKRKFIGKGDGGLISDKTARTMKKKK